MYLIFAFGGYFEESAQVITYKARSSVGVFLFVCFNTNVHFFNWINYLHFHFLKSIILINSNYRLF